MNTFRFPARPPGRRVRAITIRTRTTLAALAALAVTLSPALPAGAQESLPPQRQETTASAGPATASTTASTTAPTTTPTTAPATTPTPSPTTAPAPADAGGLSLEQLLDVEVESVFGASKSLQKITEAPAAVTVVTAEEIARYGWRTLADVLRNVRGFYITDDRSYAYVGNRGFLRPGDYNTRILLTLDGHRVNDNVFDQALIQEDFQVDLGGVERIEVIRGPSSSLYGSNAFFGVVNVVTKSAADGRRAQAATDAGTLGLRGEQFTLRHQFSDGLGVSVSGGGLGLRGVRSLYYPEYDAPDSNFGVARGLDHTLRKNVFARADYAGLVVRAGYNSRDKAFPTGAYDAVFNQPSSMVDTHALVDATWNHAVGRGWTGLFRGAYDRYAFIGSYPFDWDHDPATPVSRYLDRADGDWWTGEAQLSRALGARHQFTTGFDYRRNIHQHQYSYLASPYESLWDDPRHSATAGLYVQDQVRVRKSVIVSVGLRQDHYSQFRDPLKPRLAVIYQPDNRTALKFIYGNAFRAPNVFESYYEIPGLYRSRPNLQPEEIRTGEAIVERYAGARVRLAGGAFVYRVKRLISFAADPGPDGLLSFDNIGSVDARGVEAEVEAKWPQGPHARLSYTFSNARSRDTGLTLSNSPRHVTQGLVSVPLVKDTFLSLDTQILSARTSRSGARVPGYLRPSVTLTGPVMHGALRMTLTVSNVTNQGYADPVGDDFAQDVVRQNGRTARLQMTVGF